MNLKVLRRKVRSSRNSVCNVPLDWLDWNHWWTDDWNDGFLYLHVQGLADNEYVGDSVQRVRCRWAHKLGVHSVRIAWHDGELYWLISREDV